MDIKSRKMEEKKADRGDLNKSLRRKLFEDLDIANLVLNRDRGDSRINPARQRLFYNSNEKPTNSIQKLKVDKKKTIEITVSEVKSRKINHINNGDGRKTEQNSRVMLREEKKQSEESKGKTDNKISVQSEKNTKPQLEADRKEEKSKNDDKFKSVDENTRKINQKNMKTVENTYTIDSKGNKIDGKVKRTEENTRMIEKNKSSNENSRIYDTLKLEEENKINNKNATNIEDNLTRVDKMRNRRLPPKEKINERYLRGPVQILEVRKLLRQKYTVKLKNSNRNVETKDNCVKENDNCETNILIEDSKNQPSDPDNKKSNKTKKTKDSIEVQRRPIIKTIRLNNDNRMYKAVTFVDERNPVPPIQIKMPNSKKSVETNTIKNKFLKLVVSKVSVQEKAKKKVRERKTQRKEKIRNRELSPVFPTVHGCSQTEVAKWAPSSINQLTKPYYEAWVDTTLTAVTKCSERQKEFLNKQNIIRTFKRAINMEERPDSPYLIYDRVNDEKFMGKITVRQKGK